MEVLLKKIYQEGAKQMIDHNVRKIFRSNQHVSFLCEFHTKVSIGKLQTEQTDFGAKTWINLSHKRGHPAKSTKVEKHFGRGVDYPVNYSRAAVSIPASQIDSM